MAPNIDRQKTNDNILNITEMKAHSGKYALAFLTNIA